MSEPTFKVGDRVRIKDDAFSDMGEIDGRYFRQFRGYFGTISKPHDYPTHRVWLWQWEKSDKQNFDLTENDIELVIDAND